MAVPPRSTVSLPIRVFVDIPSVDTLDAVNALVNDVNSYLGKFISGQPVNAKPVAQLPATAAEGTQYYATDGRKIGEGSGAGTGVWVYFSVGTWRVKSTDAPVLS